MIAARNKGDTSSGAVPQRVDSSAHRRQAYALQNRDKVARLLRSFASPRKRLGLTSDELLIFFAVGYLCATISTGGALQVTPVGLVDIAALLGIPKETIRRKIRRLAALEYVSCGPKGVLINEISLWGELLERLLT